MNMSYDDLSVTAAAFILASLGSLLCFLFYRYLGVALEERQGGYIPCCFLRYIMIDVHCAAEYLTMIMYSKSWQFPSLMFTHALYLLMSSFLYIYVYMCICIYTGTDVKACCQWP